MLAPGKLGGGAGRSSDWKCRSSVPSEPRPTLSRVLFPVNSFYYKTFARVALLPYVGGTIIHILRLIYDFPIEQMPTEVDWVVIVIGGYAGVGLIVFANRVPFENLWDKVGYGLLIFHLDGSVVVHAYMLFTGSHDFLGLFPYWYSFLAVGYFIGLGLYVRRLKNRLYKERRS